MRILVDMNLSPAWIDTFTANGWEALHWSEVRSKDLLPESIGSVVLRALKENQEALQSGALVVIDPGDFRVRILPI